MTSDEQLMLQFRAGSRDAFEEIFERYRDPLYGFFRRRISNGARAEDLTQDVFLAVIRAKERYEPKALVRTYLYAIALKLVSAERRWQSKNQVTSLIQSEPSDMVRCPLRARLRPLCTWNAANTAGILLPICRVLGAG